MVATSVSLVSQTNNMAYCSGVAISPTRILTAEHCKVGALDGVVWIRFEGDQEVTRTVIESKDLINDLMVLKAEGTNFRFAKVGDSDTVRRGDSVSFVGAPNGFQEFSFGRGVVAYVGRYIPDEFLQRTLPGYFQLFMESRPGRRSCRVGIP